MNKSVGGGTVVSRSWNEEKCASMCAQEAFQCAGFVYSGYQCRFLKEKVDPEHYQEEKGMLLAFKGRRSRNHELSFSAKMQVHYLAHTAKVTFSELLSFCSQGGGVRANALFG